MEREPHLPNYAELKKAQEDAERQRQEPTRSDQVRSPGWTDRGGMEAQQQSAIEYNKRANEHLQNLQERKEEKRPDAVNAPENDHKIEKQQARQQETKQAGPEQQTEKKAEQEFDAKRFMTDPDYRREMKEQRVAEQRERTETRERQQGQERPVSTGRGR